MKRDVIYAFIDSQNLNLGVRNLGWKLDFNRFLVFLKHRFRVTKTFIFIGYIPRNKNLYAKLSDFGYSLVFKPVTIGKNGRVKGNIDAELVLHSVKVQYSNYDKAVVVSGDGDFYCLYEELEKDKKLSKIIIPSYRCQSQLLKKFEKYKFIVEKLRHKLEKK